MSKISISFLVGFALVAGTAAASAEGAMDASAMSNSVSSKVQAMDGMRASAKLNDGKANPFSQTASSLTGSPLAQDAGINVPVASAKIGSGSSLSLPTNPLTDASKNAAANMANELQSGTAHGATDQSFKSSVVLGAATSDLSNAIGDQVRSNVRLGK